MDPGLDPRLESSHRAPRSGEPLSKIDFERRDLMRDRCHLGQDIGRKETQRDSVRVVKNNRVVDCQAER